MDKNKSTDISPVDKEVSEMSNLEKLEVMQNFVANLTQNNVGLDADIAEMVDTHFHELF
ncbi:hypothetical protein ACE193_20990 [Bernardetia sp. OM2101]|uniref:hypothetical protein n=1 Tax=Bernardetia sp. OM2101 TaxID=3344876 RepID=UPI0035D09E1F